MDWHDYFKTDKILLAAMILIFLGVWLVTRNDKLFDLANTFGGALLGLITGTLLKRGNGDTK